MRSYVFASDKLCVNAGVNEGSSHDENVTDEVDCCQVKYDEYLSDEEQIELLQQQEFINSLFDRRYCFNGADDEFFINADNDRLLLLNGHVENDGQVAGVFAEMGNQDSILMKAEEIVTAEDNEDVEDVLLEEMPRLWHEQRTEPQREGVQMVRTEMIEDEKVPSCELEQKDILEGDGAEGRLADSLKKCSKNWNRHSDVLIEEKRKLGQHLEMLTEEWKALRPCRL